MPRNDRSDSLSVREQDDPRRLMKGMQQETELELGRAEATQSGGAEHQGAAERRGTAPAAPEQPAHAPDAPGADEHP